MHRDIKPSNILLAGRLKITDFGIAHIANSTLTQTGVALGTPTYMAPEQYRGLGVDHRVDLFASAALLYEIATGQQPFAGESLQEVAYKVCHADPVPATRLRRELPPAIDVVLARGLAKDKEARFATANELASAVAGALFRNEIPTGGARKSMQTAATASASPVSSLGSGVRPESNVTAEAMGRITLALAKYVGPIAKVLVKKAGATAAELSRPLHRRERAPRARGSARPVPARGGHRA